MFSPPDLLKDKILREAPTCRGWGPWDRSLVFANSEVKAIKLKNGTMPIPPRSVAVQPTFDMDVAIGWQSCIAGKVNVRAKVVRADPGSPDGVSWTIIHAGQIEQKVLAQGTLDRVESISIPAAADADTLAAITVQKGDGLCLLIDSRELSQCESTTVVDLVITEAGASGRTWDLAKDVAADIQAGNGLLLSASCPCM